MKPKGKIQLLPFLMAMAQKGAKKDEKNEKKDSKHEQRECAAEKGK